MPLATGDVLELPAGAARHVQVLRLQPGDAITLFTGDGRGEFEAVVTRMGRSSVAVSVGAHHAVDREPPHALHLAAALIASDRMDWLVEKATELGVASIQPLVAARSVLKLAGERAEKKRAHWQAVAVAACEQCGRNRVPDIHAVQTLGDWLAQPRTDSATPPALPASATAPDAPGRWLLSLHPQAQPLARAAAASSSSITTTSTSTQRPLILLCGPEGGFTDAEEALALARGFAPVSLGARVLRAETAPLAALAALTLAAPTPLA